MRDREPETSRIDEAIAEYLQLLDAGQLPNLDEFLKRYNDVRDELAEFIQNERDARQGLGHTPSAILALEQTVDFVKHPQAATSPRDPGSQALPRSVGPYRLIQKLGEGGMGQVYEALDETDQHVAIKFLNPEWSKSPDSVERFKQEGALAGTINHPRCVFVRTVGEIDGQLFIAMELMSGKTLRDLVAQGGPLPVTEAIAKILDVIDGLEEAHHRGVIHRDIKPANCFLEPNGRVKLGDFGLARSTQADSNLTQTGGFVGTPLFASPEQIKGETLDVRTDIYSICATLYYLLTGQAPFGQYSATQVIARIVCEDPAPIRKFNPALPKLLEQIVARGLNRDRDRRFTDLDELRQALEPFMRGRLAVAQLTRRLAAYGFDTCLLTGLLYLISAMTQSNPFSMSDIDFPTLLIIHGIVWLYYLGFEGYWGATPGKWALHIAVADSQTGERPAFRKILVRVAVYLIVGTELGSLIIWWQARDSSNSNELVALLSSLLGLVLLVPLWMKPGWRLLHDIASGTMVLARHRTTKRIQLVPKAPLKLLGVNSSAGWPERFGPFQVDGIVWQCPHAALLVGRDPALSRQIWLVVEPTSERQTNPWSRQHSRPTRLRWLDSGKCGQWTWNAFVAPQGAPLRYWVSPQFKFTWQETRSILEQLIDEFQYTREFGEPLPLLSLDQLWLDTHGRVVLLDFPLDPQLAAIATAQIANAQSNIRPDAQPAGNSGTTGLNRAEAAFALEAGRMCLTAQSKPLTETLTNVQTPLPVHARQLLNELSQVETSTSPPMELGTLKQRLRESANRPATVSTAIRVWMLGISALTLLPLLGAMTSLGRIGNQVVLVRLCDAWMEVSALQHIVSDSELLHDWHREFADPSQPASRLSEAALPVLAASDFQLRSEIETRWRHSNAIQRQILTQDVLPEIFLPGKTVQFSRSSKSSTALNVRDDLGRYEDQEITFDQLRKRWESVDGAKPLLTPRQERVSLFLAQLPLLFLAIWCTLLRGGLPFLLSGIRIVRSDGRMAGLGLRGLRSILMLMPMSILCAAIVAIDLYLPSLGRLAAALHVGMVGLLLVYAAVTLRWPQRSPQDWLLGTHLVPP